jgi:hypothetical protein
MRVDQRYRASGGYRITSAPRAHVPVAKGTVMLCGSLPCEDEACAGNTVRVGRIKRCTLEGGWMPDSRRVFVVYGKNELAR